ncbi:MAG: DUF4905 domain-containing protein [Ignavibacteriales bacterium]|nr:DUF4905 domain-containing protein [Ignavibacteriales bacterium]
MKILSFFSTHKQTLDWSYDSGSTIWRLLFAENGRIVGENRNEQTKQASFFCLDEATGNHIWAELKLDEPWWVGMEAVQKDILLLHEFAKPDLPEHRGIRAYDLETARLLWHKKDMTFWFGYQNSVYAYKTMFERRIGYSLDLNSGEVLQEYAESLEELHAVRELSTKEQRQDEYRFPEILDLNKVEPRIVETVKKATRNTQIHGNIEFVREKEFLLFNYHAETMSSTADSILLENHLEIVDIEKNHKVYSDLLVRGAKAPAPDSFFIKGHRVYFIKDQHILSALRLWK